MPTCHSAKRLTAKQRWSRKYTDRAVAEYRRFLYLTQIAPHDLTPSKSIDAVWHLHLTYTESYWDRLCALFERPLHHRPSMGGPAEESRYESQYSLTLASSEQEFGEPLPTDAWPRSGARPDLWSDCCDAVARRLPMYGSRPSMIAAGDALVVAADQCEPFAAGRG